MITALLLNALVLPGTGHWYAGYRLRGAVLAIISVFFVIAPTIKYMLVLSHVADVMRLQTPQILPTLPIMLSTAWQQVAAAVYLALGGILIVWVFGIIDIYQKTKDLEVEE